MGKVTVTGLLVLVAAALLSPPPAVAELGEGTVCMACRAIAHFKTCNKPVDGTQIIRGRVTGVKKGQCSLFISFQPLRAAEQGLPAQMSIDLGPCAVWAGKTNSTIDVAVAEASTFADKNYALACRHW
jgi:hypothetical protein